MEYGAAYLRPERTDDDDSASMLVGNRASQYQPYRPEHRRQSSDAAPARLSWNVSPIALQQSLPPMPSTNESPSNMTPSLFSSRAVLSSPYQESIAWERSTIFRSTRPESPKPEGVATSAMIPETERYNEARRYFRHPRHIPEPWRTGFWLRFPWLGFGALFSVLLFTGASAGILLASNGSTPEDWRIGDDDAQPPVYISVFEMIMNFLILFALAGGVVIKFWRELLHGSTLSAMHDVYESSSLLPAFKRIIRLQFNVVAVACLLALVSSLRGPLFQRALVVHDDSTSNTEDAIDLKIAPFPMAEYFQSSDSDPRKQGAATRAFSDMLKNVSSGSALSYERPPECGDRCTGIIKGYGFKVDCSSSTRSFNLRDLPDECKSCSTGQCVTTCNTRLRTEFSPTFFSIEYEKNASTSDDQSQALTLTSIVKDQPSCVGDVQVHTCTLTQTTSDYTIVLANGSIERVANDNTSTVHNDNAPFDKRLMDTYWPLAIEFLFPPVSVNITPARDFSRLEYSKCNKPSDASLGCSNDTFVINDASVSYATASQAPADQDALCGLTWRDPMQDIIDKLQSLAFRITVDMANSDGAVFAPKYTGTALSDLRKDWKQTVSVASQKSRTVYKTNKTLVALGVVLSAAGVIAILPLYMGFWELGRNVSLNPLEIARAFGAPLMEGMDGNATPDMIMVERGGMSVRYGALERFGDEKKLRIEESARATVRVPWQGEIFG